MKENKVFDIISNIIFVVLIVCSILLTVKNTCFIQIVVSGSSMSPTLTTNEYGYANKTQSAIDNIDRFDIIIFDVTDGENTTGLIKRVVGLPGETIEFKGENFDLYVDDVLVEQSFISLETQKKTGLNLNYGFSKDTPIKLDETSYFVLGDNRANSRDSLHGLGLVDKSQIVGVLVAIFGSCSSLNQKDDVLICEDKKIENIRFF